MLKVEHCLQINLCIVVVRRLACIIEYHASKWKRKTIGFSARSVDNDINLKYFTSHDSGSQVYGIDNQLSYSRFVIVIEGLFDAVCIGGVGIMNNP